MQRKQKWLSAAAATRWDGKPAMSNGECLGAMLILIVIVGVMMAINDIWPNHI